jgi:hypothetical protein
VNLVTWHGVGKDFLEFDSKKSGSALYLNLKYTKVHAHKAPTSHRALEP